MKDIIIHAGRNLYPHEIEDVVAQVPGVRKGCVVAFGAADPTTGTERLVIVAETREKDREPRARIAQAITAQVSAALGLPPDVVEMVAPNAIPKTSSGKLQRDATKKRFLSGELDSIAPPAWMQIGRLAATSSVGRIRGALRRAVEVAYGCYALAIFGIVLLPAWLLVLISPTRKMAARITTAALRTYLTLAGWRVRVEGREHIRENVPRMFVSNHTSYVDVVVLMAALGTDFHFVAKGEVRSMPFFRTFLRKLGHFAFNREDSRVAIAASRPDRGNAAPRRIRVRLSGRNIHRATRRAAIPSRRVQGGHRGSPADRADCARWHASSSSRRHVAAASRQSHDHDLPADLSAVRRIGLARNRPRARCGTGNNFPFRERNSPLNFPFAGNRCTKIVHLKPCSKSRDFRTVWDPSGWGSPFH